MALVKGPIRITWLKQFLLWAKTVFDGAAMVFIGVDLDQIDKMAPRRVESAPGPIELNQHFGAKTDLLDLECAFSKGSCGSCGVCGGSKSIRIRVNGTQACLF